MSEILNNSDGAPSETPGQENLVEVTVFRSVKKAQTYVYVPANQTYEELPESFRAHFGEAVAFLTFELHAQKKLVQADAVQVMKSIVENGFYLQLPPPEVPEHRDND